MQQQRRKCRVVGPWLIAMLMAASPAQPALAQADIAVQSLWELQLPPELQARIYETAIVPGEARVVATTPGAILRIDEQGAVRPLLQLEFGGARGESATLAGNGNRAGILIHQNHAVQGFRLIDLQGQTLASIEAPLNFHYRLAPDGATFVGIDAGGEHVQANAERFIYRFYNDSGEVMAQVDSVRPQQTLDSAYTSDGAAFVTNSGIGLAAYRITDGELLWRVTRPTRFFAAGPAESGLVVASDAVERQAVGAFRAGSPLWRFTLGGNARHLSVSPNGAFILAADGGAAHLFSPQSGDPLWSFEMPNQALTINSAAVNDRGVVALGAQHSSLSSGLALILDSKGGVRFERTLTHQRSNAWIPGVQFDASGTAVLIRTLEELILVATR